MSHGMASWPWTWWLGFDPRQGLRMFLLTCMFRQVHPAPYKMGTKGPVLRVRALKWGQGMILTSHPHLVLRSSTDRSYVSSSPSFHWNSFTLRIFGAFRRKSAEWFFWKAFHSSLLFLLDYLLLFVFLCGCSFSHRIVAIDNKRTIKFENNFIRWII